VATATGKRLVFGVSDLLVVTTIAGLGFGTVLSIPPPFREAIRFDTWSSYAALAVLIASPWLSTTTPGRGLLRGFLLLVAHLAMLDVVWGYHLAFDIVSAHTNRLYAEGVTLGVSYSLMAPVLPYLLLMPAACLSVRRQERVFDVATRRFVVSAVIALVDVILLAVWIVVLMESLP